MYYYKIIISIFNILIFNSIFITTFIHKLYADNHIYQNLWYNFKKLFPEYKLQY